MIPKTVKGWLALLAWVMLLLAMAGKFFINLESHLVYRANAPPYWDYKCYIEFLGFGYRAKDDWDKPPWEDSEHE